jgi:hypothetical protein
MSDNGGLHAGRSYVRRHRDQQMPISWREPVGDDGDLTSSTAIQVLPNVAGSVPGLRRLPDRLAPALAVSHNEVPQRGP